MATSTHYFSQDLRQAIRKGSIREIKAVQVKDWNQADGSGSTALTIACYHGHLDVVEFLVEECQALLHHADVCQKTPLHYACDNGKPDVVRYLLNCGADVKACNSRKETPLLSACSKGQIEVVKVLLEWMEVKSAALRQALSVACFSWQKGCMDVVKYLVESDPEIHSLVNSQDDEGRTPLYQALRSWKYGNKQCSVRAEKTRLIEYLIRQGADVDRRAFTYAVTSSNDSAVYWMIRLHPELWGPLRQLRLPDVVYTGPPKAPLAEPASPTSSNAADASRWSKIIKYDSFEMAMFHWKKRGGKRNQVQTDENLEQQQSPSNDE